VATAVAIISVVATAAVAIAVPFINTWLERQRMRYESSQERFGELRTLIDEAAQRFTDAQTVIVELMTISVGSQKAGAADRLTKLAKAVFRDNTRLALRLGGEHRVYRAHIEAMSPSTRSRRGCESRGMIQRRRIATLSDAESGRSCMSRSNS